MPKQYTIKARIEGEDAFSPAARSAQQGTEQLVKSLEKLGIEGEAAQGVIGELAKGLEEGAEEARKAGESFEDTARGVGASKQSLGEVGSAARDAGIEFDRVGEAARAFGAGIVASFGAAAAAAIGFSQSIRLVDEAAKLEGVKSGLAGVLAETGENVDAYLARISAATNGTVDEFRAASAAMEGFLRGLPIQQIPALFEIARDVANTTGVEVEEAFNRISSGIVGASEKSLRLAGVFVDVEAALAKFATESGKTVEALSQQEKQLAVLAGVYESYTERVETAGKATATSRIGIEQTIQSLKDLGGLIGTVLLAPVNALLSALSLLTSALFAVGQGMSEIISVVLDLGSYLPGVGGAFESLRARMVAVTTGLDEQRRKFFENSLALGNWFTGMQAAAAGTDALARALADLNAQLENAKNPVAIFNAELAKLKEGFDSGKLTLDEYLTQYDALKTAFETGATAAQRAAAATGEQARASGEAAASIGAAADANRKLAEETDKTATAFTGSQRELDAYVEALVNRLIPSLDRVREKAAETQVQLSGVFDRSGNELPAGGTFELGGTRYRPPGQNGSVLVGAAGGVRNSASNIGVNYQGGGGAVGAPFSGRFLIDTPQYGTIEAFKVASYGFGPSGAGVSTYGVLPGGRIVQLSG